MGRLNAVNLYNEHLHLFGRFGELLHYQESMDVSFPLKHGISLLTITVDRQETNTH